MRLWFLKGWNAVRNSLDACQCSATVRKGSQQQKQRQRLKLVSFADLIFGAGDGAAPP